MLPNLSQGIALLCAHSPDAHVTAEAGRVCIQTETPVSEADEAQLQQLGWAMHDDGWVYEVGPR